MTDIFGQEVFAPTIDDDQLSEFIKTMEKQTKDFEATLEESVKIEKDNIELYNLIVNRKKAEIVKKFSSFVNFDSADVSVADIKNEISKLFEISKADLVKIKIEHQQKKDLDSKFKQEAAKYIEQKVELKTKRDQLTAQIDAIKSEQRSVEELYKVMKVQLKISNQLENPIIVFKDNSKDRKFISLEDDRSVDQIWKRLYSGVNLAHSSK